jgi:glycosyltransferase involved in cell wall biosynthesis
MRCALIEHNYHHEQVLPTFVYLLNELGVVPDVYLPRFSVAADPFAYARTLRYHICPVDGRFARLRGTPRRLGRYDVVIYNSIEPPWVLQKAAAQHRPLVSVLHNADLLTTHPDYVSFFQARNRVPLVLARHVAESLDGRHVRWVAPVHLGEIARPPDGDCIRLAVQGNVEANRRNYESLLDAIEEVVQQSLKVRVLLIGRSDLADGKRLKEEIRRRHLDEWFEVTGELPYTDFLKAIASCRFVLALIDRSSEIFASYYRFKLTSSLLMSLAVGVPPVVHAELARLYGLEHASITYEDGGLAGAIARGAALDSRAHESLVREISTLRGTLLARSASNLQGAIDAALG